MQDAFRLLKSCSKASIHPAILHRSKSRQRDDDDDAERLDNISGLHEILLVHLVQSLYYEIK